MTYLRINANRDLFLNCGDYFRKNESFNIDTAVENYLSKIYLNIRIENK